MMPPPFSYRNGALCVEALPVAEIVEQIDTPFYCTSLARLQENYRAFTAPFESLNATIHYAVKANPSLAIIRALGTCGAGADITSSGELTRALEAGILPGKIVFSGAGKTKEDLTAALLAEIYQINVESIPELILLDKVARKLNRVAPVAIRVNPDVHAKTHEKTSTGHKETKFGVNLDQLAEAMQVILRSPYMSFKGLMVHVGSHVYDYAPFRAAFERLADIVKMLRAEGIPVERLDLGGGVGIPYDGQQQAPFADYAAIVHEVIAPLGCEISFEPGRRLVGDASMLVTRIVHVKPTTGKTFLIVDAGMNDLVRPAMYGARHEIIPAREAGHEPLLPQSVVGPVCETSDLFGDAYALPEMQENDLIAILQAGAYGAAMSSTYNGRPLIPEVLVHGVEHAVVRRRVPVSEQMGWEAYPEWMVKPRAA